MQRTTKNTILPIILALGIGFAAGFGTGKYTADASLVKTAAEDQKKEKEAVKKFYGTEFSNNYRSLEAPKK